MVVEGSYPEFLNGWQLDIQHRTFDTPILSVDRR